MAARLTNRQVEKSLAKLDGLLARCRHARKLAEAAKRSARFPLLEMLGDDDPLSDDTWRAEVHSCVQRLEQARRHVSEEARQRMLAELEDQEEQTYRPKPKLQVGHAARFAMPG